MEKINSNESLQKQVSFEQTGDNIYFSLPNGETLSVQGTFKGPELTSYEGVDMNGNSTQVEFDKNDDMSLFVVEIKVNGKTIYPEVMEEFKDAA